ncbi:hypothetical protein K469DRAFT_334684 [Zopfia rhizophila CBS 207.26]|uniref:Uncharacterized protein n=1 Tax=Zopfia rhizophila CBS 207.26 TaxID=1314779 RepID=A0A6A6DH68_9PEZI|nr:hypothetical protein K469DRAFT_334684 [Zopfia rhizophila CBS 207.26]
MLQCAPRMQASKYSAFAISAQYLSDHSITQPQIGSLPYQGCQAVAKKYVKLDYRSCRVAVDITSLLRTTKGQGTRHCLSPRVPCCISFIFHLNCHQRHPLAVRLSLTMTAVESSASFRDRNPVCATQEQSSLSATLASRLSNRNIGKTGKHRTTRTQAAIIQ